MPFDRKRPHKARRRRSSRAISQPARAISATDTARNSVASALTCGLTPRRTLENTAIGKVVADGPLTKLATTRSSSDRVKASSQPATRAGRIRGRVIAAIPPRAGAEIERGLFERAVERRRAAPDQHRDEAERRMSHGRS